jgi:cold shock CspA family protein
MRGELLWFNEAKGFGFIQTEDDERLYVHLSGFMPGQVPDGPCAGTKVTFERQDNGGPDGTPSAVDVAPLDDVPARRARLRHRHNIH